MVLAWICGELWRGQAQNGVNLAFPVKFDLEGQGQSPPKTIGTLTKFFCTFCPNLMVLAWTRDDLWHGQAQGWRTHTQTDTHTDRQTQATTIPEGQNWPRVKMCWHLSHPITSFWTCSISCTGNGLHNGATYCTSKLEAYLIESGHYNKCGMSLMA